MRAILLTGIGLAASAVMLGAWGAHGLENLLGADSNKLATWETAVDYQFVHALALLFIALWQAQQPHSLLNKVAGLMLLGVILFSGSLYLLVLGAPSWLGPVTPIGGLLLIVSWLLAAVVAAQAKPSS